MVKIVKAKVSDAQEIRRLETRVWGEEVVNKYDAPMFIRFGWCFAAKDKNKIVGAICSYLTKNNEVYVCDWVVDKRFRERSIGVNLYKKLLKAVPGKHIISFIDPKNIASLEAHKKLGFKIDKIMKNVYGLKHGIEGGERILVRLKKRK